MSGVLLNRKLYIYLYFINSLFYAMPIPNVWFASKVMKVLLLWGLFILICDFCTHKKGLKNFNCKWLLIFLLWECVSCAANLDMNLYTSIQDLIYNSIFFFILYGQNDSSEHCIKFLYNFNQILIIIMLIAGGISMGMFFGRVAFIYEYKGMSFPQGIYARRLTGCIGANAGTVLGIISVVASYINYKIKKRYRILYIINAVIQVLFISLASSRGAFVTWSAMWVLFCLFYIYKKIKKKIYYILPSVLCIMILCFAGTVGFYRGTACINTVLGIYINQSSGVENQESYSGKGTEEPIILEQASSRSKRENDITTGRIDIWKAAFKGIQERTVLGYGNARMVDSRGNVYIEEGILNSSEISTLQRINGYLHNNYIQILVSVGIVGFTWIGIFMLIEFMAIYRKMINGGKNQLLLVLLFCILGGLMVNSVFEAHLLFHQGDSIGVIFWFYLGCAFIIGKNERRKLTNG